MQLLALQSADQCARRRETAMRAIGLNFHKGRIRVISLDHANDQWTVETSRAVTIDPELPLPELMDRYATQCRTLIDEFQPEIVAVRRVWDSGNVTAAMCQIAPVGIAALVCGEKGVPFASYTPQALRQPTKFGLPKGTNPINAVDGTFGTHPPHWDDLQRGALLVAWRAVLDA